MFKAIGQLFSTPYERDAPSSGEPDTRTLPPVPWIATTCWQKRNAPYRYDPEIEAPEDPCKPDGKEFISGQELEALMGCPQVEGACTGPWATVEEVFAESVSEKVVQHLPRLTDLQLPKLDPANEDRLQEMLEGTPAILAQWNALYWPHSGGRLWVLIAVNPFTDELAAIEAQTGPLEKLTEPACAWANLRFDAWAEAWRFELARIRAGKRPHEGLHIWADPETGAVVGNFSPIA